MSSDVECSLRGFYLMRERFWRCCFVRNFLTLAFLSAFLFGCSSFSIKDREPISLAPLPDLEFTGRGSAAAFMLSGSMGAAGIAIGTAIDVGLAKDAERGFSEIGFSWQDSLRTQFLQSGFKLHESASRKVTVSHVGFKAVGDDVVAWLDVMVTDGEDAWEYQSSQEHSISFEQFKNSAEDVRALLVGELEALGDFIASIE